MQIMERFSLIGYIIQQKIPTAMNSQLSIVKNAIENRREIAEQ